MAKDKTRRAALYARVSTQDQHAEIQLDVLRTYAKDRGLAVAEEFVDRGVSGAKSRRPALDKLLADAHRRRFDLVVCVKLDRLARSVHHLSTLAKDFESLGIDLVVLDQSIDTSTSAGRFLFNALAAVAELERDLIRERTRAGVAAARRRGSKLGRPRKLDRRGIDRAKRLAKNGKRPSAIAEQLGVYVSTVRRVVRSGGGSPR